MFNTLMALSINMPDIYIDEMSIVKNNIGPAQAYTNKRNPQETVQQIIDV